MKAYNRNLREWFELIESGRLTLPYFQRKEAWTHREVTSLLYSMLNQLPVGAALILQVADKQQFDSRVLEGAQPKGNRPIEQLLDGQQRLTALWKSLHEKYHDRVYFVRINKNTIGTNMDASDYLNSYSCEIEVESKTIRYKNGKKYPLGIDEPKKCWEAGLIPVRLLCPNYNPGEKRKWVSEAEPQNTEMQEFLHVLIERLYERVLLFNIPYLFLPYTTKKNVALDVFTKLNTTFVKLDDFDKAVAEVAGATGKSLHELVDSLDKKVPSIEGYEKKQDLVLDTVALLQDLPPGKKGYSKINHREMVDEWDDLARCFTELIKFLEDECIYDGKRLPSYPALPVIAALTKYLPKNPDQLGNARLLIKKYMWRAFLTDRYEKTTATNSYSDFRKIRDCILGKAKQEDIPIFNEQDYPVPVKEIIADAPWPRTRTILGRGLLALQIKCRAYDIADRTPAGKQSISDREYHHLFPRALLKKADVPFSKIQRAVNCALISGPTNRTISDKNPRQYLLERSEGCDLGKPEIERRLRTHLIPVKELKKDYDELDSPETKKKIAQDYEEFINKRAELLEIAARLACDGEELDHNKVFSLYKEKESS